MIIDTLDNLVKYESINPLFKDVVEFLKKNDLNKMPEGKHQIKGNDLFVNITTTKGKTPDEAILETHINMIDIQIPLEGFETYGYTPICRLPKSSYNAEKDITKYDGMAESFRRESTVYGILSTACHGGGWCS